jgi:hypothetical protein
MKSKLIIICLVILVVGIVYASIGTGSFSVDAKKGFAYHFGTANIYSEWEPKLIVELEAQGLAYNTERLNNNVVRQDKIQQIKAVLPTATDEQIAAALTALGL